MTSTTRVQLLGLSNELQHRVRGAMRKEGIAWGKGQTYTAEYCAGMARAYGEAVRLLHEGTGIIWRPRSAPGRKIKKCLTKSGRCDLLCTMKQRRETTGNEGQP